MKIQRAQLIIREEMRDFIESSNIFFVENLDLVSGELLHKLNLITKNDFFLSLHRAFWYLQSHIHQQMHSLLNLTKF